MDKRVEPRIAHNVRFFVHIQACDDDPELVGLSLECTAIDLSRRGMQFQTDIQLLSRTSLGITIGVGEPFAMFELNGTVRWIRSEGDGFRIGVLLEENDSKDYEKWQDAFTTIFSSDRVAASS